MVRKEDDWKIEAIALDDRSPFRNKGNCLPSVYVYHIPTRDPSPIHLPHSDTCAYWNISLGASNSFIKILHIEIHIIIDNYCPEFLGLEN